MFNLQLPYVYVLQYTNSLEPKKVLIYVEELLIWREKW